MQASGKIEEIRKHARKSHFPDGESYWSLSTAAVRKISHTLSVPQREIELHALETGIVPENYSRNLKTLSTKDQAALLCSRAAVVGLGGLGGNVVEILARIGVGTLYLADGDTFEDSNLNRQLLSSHDTLGLSKAKTAGQRVEKINPSVEVHLLTTFVAAANGPNFLNRADVIVDCLDNLKTRFLLESFAKQAGVPFVSGAVAGVTGHITTIFPQDVGLKSIYGEVDQAPEKGAETSLGTLPHCVTTVAAIEASEVIKVLLGQNENLRNRLLTIDLQDNTFEVMQLR